MIEHIPYENLGQADYGWLQARYHFSFSQYHNPARMGFGTVRVINDDIVKAGSGFDMHPHKNMEIITFVRKGAITHRDSVGNAGRTVAGDVQVMSAGKGVFHSEFNLESEDTSLYQIWIEPNQSGVEPRWDAMTFPKTHATQALHLLVSGNGADGALTIHQDAKIYGGKLLQGSTLNQTIKHQAYVLVSDGKIRIDGKTLAKGDAAQITQQSSFEITAVQDAEVIVIDAPATNSKDS